FRPGLRDIRHLREDRLAVAGTACKNRAREDHIIRHAAMAVGKSHVRIGMLDDITLAVDAAAGDENVPRLGPIGARVHPERAANGTGDAAKKRKAREACLGGGGREFYVKTARSRGQKKTLDRDLLKTFAEADHDAFNAAVAHQNVRARAKR